MKRAAAVFAATLLASCVVSKEIRVEPVVPGRGAAVPPVEVRSPVKAHLLDGSTIVFAKGARVGPDSVIGTGKPGEHFDLALRPLGPVRSIPLDSVAAMEAFPPNRDVTRTVVYSAAGTVAGIFGFAGLMVAIFGSCPTIYADSAGVAVLEAEAFSYSIAPIFESRDVDRLVAGPGADGSLVLEIRNEALETDSINHVELLDVEHGPAERVAPDERDLPVALGELRPADQVVDRVGRDLRSILAAADDAVFASANEIRDAATVEDLQDWIDVTAHVPAGADSVAIVLRMRNSLLNTVLLYDVMLGGQGPGALDWVGQDLARVGEAARLGRWYHARMGMRVSVENENGRFEKRVGDAGPIAWKDVVVVVPAPARGPLRARLSFAADQWRIDRLEIAGRARRPGFRTVPVADVRRPGGNTDLAAVEALRSPDGAYVVTEPGTSFSLRFHLAPPRVGSVRTLLLATQGYYVEWIRAEWIRRPGAAPFQPTDEALVTAMRRWREVQTEFEGQFYSRRVPVR